MIDNFALAVTHFLIVVAVIRLLRNDAVDHDDTGEAAEPRA